MKYCSTCGKELADNAQSCPNCGFVFANTGAVAAGINDRKNGGIAFLGFLFPLIGIILYFVWKPATPLRASSAGKGAVIGIIVQVVFYILYAIGAAALYM